MNTQQTLLEALMERGVSRRSFLKFAGVTASALALSSQQARVFADALANVRRPTVIWLSFQQCTGCSESILRSFDPSIETLVLDVISLDYHETLQVAAGEHAEKARKDAMAAAYGQYVLIVDGAIPTGESEFWSCAAGNSNLATLNEAVSGAALVVALGTCAAYGGIPAAYPNPTHAAGYADLVAQGLVRPSGEGRLPPFVNIAGCPPMASVITGTIAYYLVHGIPQLDAYFRPVVFYGQTVHDSCPRLSHFIAGNFANSYGDEGARQGYCLIGLGCKGPETFNACTALGWNRDPSTSEQRYSPTLAGHGCIGCSEPQFWDKGFDPITRTFRSSFYY